MRKVGVIGGTGLYSLEGLKVKEEKKIVTPFGEPSDSFILGEMEGIEVVFLSRHGRGHRILPSEINYRANIYAFKVLGVERIISVSAVGSLKEDIHPMDVVIPEQFFDRTKRRIDTFFGDGIVAHVGVADPVCPVLSDILFESARKEGAIVHKGGTYVTIEG
ncbi:MTAP family purine nucleoside phosphorylase, partial [Candidatus Calescamantes bacterium]|nr:MTAP family purine nucleoside phosphorylase [Candidatus Calescamantes bacterium]